MADRGGEFEPTSRSRDYLLSSQVAKTELGRI